MTPRELIFGMLSRKVDLRVLPWLERTAVQWMHAPEEKSVFASFSAAIRRSGKGPLSPIPGDLEAANILVPGWNPSDWTLDESARIYLLLSLPTGADSARIRDLLYQTADLGEALALMKALPILPDPDAHLDLATRGARSNVKSQFEAVALRNPFPSLHFDETSWNQMVAKAIFIDSPLLEIQGVQTRANPRLDRILLDLVEERRAAGRDINPLLYRCLTPGSGTAASKTLWKAEPHAG